MINRRKALGALTGGVVAAPELAKQAAHKYAESQTWNTPQVSAYTGSVSDSLQKANSAIDHMKDEIEKYTKIVKGELNEYQQNELKMAHRKLTLRQSNVACLKSISDTCKEQLYLEAERSHMKEQYINDALYRLSFLKRGLWP